MQKDNTNNDMDDLRDHMANERTFLAWIRTSIGIMAFGFVLEKFSLFLKQIKNFLMNASVASEPNLSGYFSGYSAFLGIVLVAIGALMNLLAFCKYMKIARLIKNKQFKNTIILDFVLTCVVFLVGFILTIYLISNRVV